MSPIRHSRLNTLADEIMIMIAMASDEQAVGQDENELEYQQWFDCLHMAVDDGLESADRRASGLEEGR